MARELDRLVERQILKAIAEGKLKNLEGEGKPLPDHPEAAMVDPATLAAVRIMAEAGALPEEFGLKKQVDAVNAQLAAITDPVERKVIMGELAKLEMKLAIAQEARRRFLR